MREPDFTSLNKRLLRCGIAPAHAERTVNELRDHYHDLLDEAVDAGMSRNDAAARACEKLGEMDVLLAEMQSHTELKSWAFRHPRIALVLYPLGCLAMLPALPLVAGARHAPDVARWGTSLLLAGLFTATMLLVLQLSIVLG